MAIRPKLVEKDNDDGEPTYWLVPDGGPGRELTWDEYHAERDRRQLRDVFAGAALIGLLAEGSSVDLVGDSYDLADRMLIRRDEAPG